MYLHLPAAATIVAWLSISLLAVSPPARGACEPADTRHPGLITCTGTDSKVVRAGVGNDRVSVVRIAAIAAQPQARARYTSAIDLGSGYHDAAEVHGGATLHLVTAAILEASGSRCTDRESHGSVTVPSLLRVTTAAQGGAALLLEKRCTLPLAAWTTGLDGGDSSGRTVKRGVLQLASTAAPAATGAATAFSLAGGPGKDTIENRGTIDVSAITTRDSVTVALSLIGGASSTSTTEVESRAVGIDAGEGKNRVVNDGTVTVNSTMTVNSVNVEHNIADTSHGDTTTTLRSTAIGIDAGSGGGQIVNRGSIVANALSRSTAVNVEINGVDAATADAKLDVKATAVGIAGGRGRDTVHNTGSVRASADAQMLDVGVNASFVDVTIADRQGSTVSTNVTARATGIDAAQGKDDIAIEQGGTVAATANATATSIGVSLASEGVPGPTETLFEQGALASIGITADSKARGIASGSAKDRVLTSGDISAIAAANTTQASVNVGVAIFDFKLPTPGLVLGSAGTESIAAATGLDTGRGDDAMSAGGRLTARATADAGATTVSVNIAELSVDFLPGVPGIPLGASLVVADTTTNARATVRGIAAGDGNDAVAQLGEVEASARADGGATSASATLNMKFKEGETFLALNAVAARAVTSAEADATGVDGGKGADTLDNRGPVTVGAVADAQALAIGIDVAGTLQGKGGAVSVALTDASSKARAGAIGLQGGAGDDAIDNRGTVGVTSTANVGSVSVSTTIGIAKQGVVAGAALARAHTIATASAAGIDGGEGSDAIVNQGALGVRSEADALTVAVAATIEGTAKGIEGGVALVDAGATTGATAIGIRTGAETAVGGHDPHDRDGGCHACDKDKRVVNAGTINVDADADTQTVSVAAKVGIAKEGAAIGAALANTSSTTTSVAIGIEADARDDTVVNAGSIGLRSVAGADAVSVALTVEGTATGIAGGAALVDASVDSTARATGIVAGAGDDRIANKGTISSSEIRATATAVGVDVALLVAKEGGALGAALGRTRATATADVTGIDAGDGNDEVYSAGKVTLQNAKAGADAVTVSVELALAKEGLAVGAALADSGSTAQTTVRGMDGGRGNDVIVNEGQLTLQTAAADSKAVGVSVGLTGAKDGAALGAALVDAEAIATTRAAGIDGGDGRDTLVNAGSVKLDDIGASADATTVGVEFTFAKEGVAVGAALAKTGATATAVAAGLHGGSGDDKVFNDSEITLSNVRSTADAISVTVALAGANDGVAIGAALADASGTARTSAHVLAGGDGRDLIVNHGRATAGMISSRADAASISVQLGGANAGVAAGVSIADTSATASTDAHGVDGAGGDDELWNKGEIALSQVKAEAGAVSVGVSLNVAMKGVAAGAALGRARATADVRAAGMDGGAGDDLLGNKGSITVDGIEAKTDSVGVTAQLGVTNAGVAIGAALADVAATARSAAAGLDGGAGNDELVNAGDILIRNVKADATAVSVGVTLTAAISGGVAAGVALTDASGTAMVDVAGMAGGDGNDTLLNLGSLKTENVLATARATGVSVSLSASMAGVAGGASLANSSATAQAGVTGLAGGAGNDVLVNKGTVDVRGQSVADALSLAIQISGSVGVAGGAAITDASGTASAVVAGVDGGSGRDEILNEGSVHASSMASASSASISVSANVGVAGDVSLADARSTSTASAVGIQDLAGAPDDDGPCRPHAAGQVREDRGQATQGRSGDSRGGCADDRAGGGRAGKHGGDGHGGKDDRHDKHDEDDVNVIVNRGGVTADAVATSQGTSVSFSLHGFALGETTNSAASSAAGIRTDAARDVIRNEGTLTATSRATATGLAVSFDLAGKSAGDAGSTATANAVGIDTGAREDDIENHAAISVDARSSAGAQSFAVGLIGASEANASITSNATAVGIAAGDGNDRVHNAAVVDVAAGRPDQRDGTGNCTEAAGGACARAATVSVRLGGFGAADASSTSNAMARGLDGGSGDDELDNDGTVTVGSLARSRADGIGVTLLGASDVDATSAAHAGAAGLLGGAGHDRLVNRGAIVVTAAAESFARGAVFTLFGGARAASGVVASASVVGIEGGENDDMIWSAGRIDVGSISVLTSHATSFAFAGSASTSELLVASSSATGIAGGDGDNVLVNAGDLRASASAQLNATGGASSTFGGVEVAASATARTDAAGMSAAGGDDVLVNDLHGSVAVAVTASPRADNDAAAGAFFVEGVTNSVANSSAGAFGLNAGAGNNRVVNRGSIVVTAGGTTEAHSRSDPGILASIFGLENDAYANSTAVLGALSGTNERPAVAAVGIAGGAGRDRLTNEGSVTVAITTSAYAYANANGEAIFSGDGSAQAIARADDVEATGMRAGDGDNIVHNRGSISVDARPAADGDSQSDADGIGEFRQPDSRATTTVSADRTRAFGIRAGSGDNTIVNEGTLSVTAAPQADRAEADADYGGDVLGIDAFATSAASADGALAVGVLAVGSRNVVLNQAGASITVTAAPRAAADALARGGNFDGDASSFARAAADNAQAIGIRASGGENHVVNDGAISVSTAASAHAQSIASPGTSTLNDGEVEGYEESASAQGEHGTQAIGIWASGARDTVRNRGSVVVDAQAAAGLWAAPQAIGTARSETLAVGIRAGDGAGDLRNDGDLHVSARSTSDSVLTLFGFTLGTSEAAARAIGIEVGNAGNHVLNTGSIRVEATATGNTSATAEAAGIRTGSGDDTIINRGTIVATQTVNGVTVNGVAIDAGAGNDRVILGDRSVTTGTIDLGSGTNTLTLEGTPVINGGFIDGQSTLALEFLNSGSYAGALPGVAAIKDGAGTFTLSMLNPMQRIQVRQGTLHLTRDYGLLPQGTFDATVYGDGTHGQFRIGGQAQLAGRIGIVRGGGAYVDGTAYDVLLADGGIAAGSTFDRIDLPAPTRLVGFTAQQLADRYRVEAEVKSFTTVARDANQSSVASALDGLVPRVRSGDLAGALAAIQTMDDDREFGKAFNSLSPAAHGSFGRAGRHGLQQHGQVLQDRMSALRVAGLPAADTTPVRLAAAGGLGLVGAFAAPGEPAAQAHGAWIKGYAQRGRQDSQQGAGGYGHDLAGIAFGIDRRFGSSFVAGLSVGRASNGVTANVDRSDADITTRMLALYGGWFDGRAYASGTLASGRNEYDTRRTIVVGAATTPVSSRHRGDVLAASLGGGVLLPAGPSWIDPHASLQYTRLAEEGFTENGSGAGLVVGSRTTRALASTVGVRGFRVFNAVGAATWTPEASVAWLHDLRRDGHLVSAAYVDAPDAPFSIDGERVARNGALLGLGLTYRSGGLVTFLRYRGEFRNGYAAHGVVGELRYEF